MSVENNSTTDVSEGVFKYPFQTALSIGLLVIFITYVLPLTSKLFPLEYPSRPFNLEGTQYK